MTSYSLTDVGKKRLSNQDSLFVSDVQIGPLPNLYIVADGMGGELAGDYASARCVEIVTAELEKSTETQPIKALDQALQMANRLINEEANADSNKTAMGTTIVAATIVDGHLIVANVGDSRLYVAGATKLTQITKDHSVVAELVRTGKLDEDDAKTDRRKNMITRAIGAEESLTVDYFDVVLKGSENILLCSDGLTNMVDDEAIYSILSTDEDVFDKAKRLITLANNNGGKDNITVVVVAAQ
ncbi:MAG: Stp1/IreP family PP2C-type Ser/Thr phosphatase [Pseudobutyrivibrio sp.]|nr:Stp1/IreP family PP2C-type Ser/Thr phosphatase [Pseudobutyrivibrio sp.]